jgi:hypothetical protein
VRRNRIYYLLAAELVVTFRHLRKTGNGSFVFEDALDCLGVDFSGLLGIGPSLNRRLVRIICEQNSENLGSACLVSFNIAT